MSNIELKGQEEEESELTLSSESLNQLANMDIFCGGEAPQATARTDREINDISIACSKQARAALKQNNLKAYLMLEEDAVFFLQLC